MSDTTLTKEKARAPRNRTLVLTDADRKRLRPRLVPIQPQVRFQHLPEGVILGDFADCVPLLPSRSVDFLFLDPPYNLNKSFNGRKFSKTSEDEYTVWLDAVLRQMTPLLKPTASVYICGDWLTSHSIFEAASRHFQIRNRITWEREKGRGAQTNWKNTSEDIWFCTVSDEYCFNVEQVKLRRRVLAPYRNNDGKPRDWSEAKSGNFRDTYPSNLWTDISIPFWSMPENTDHPTQKSEKLLAKLLLASTNTGDMVLDPFLGSGTSVVTAKKLGRRFLGIETDEEYALLSLRRLEQADKDASIQGYTDGVFWERNTLAQQQNAAAASRLVCRDEACKAGGLFND
jgi:site-specific DNA-methyltransferase (adenine-specific)